MAVLATVVTRAGMMVVMVAAVAPTLWSIPMHFAAVIGTTATTVSSLLIRAGSLCRHLTGHSGPGRVSKDDALNGPARNEHPPSRGPTVSGPTHYWTGRSRTGLSGDFCDIPICHLHCLPVLAADLVIVFLEATIPEGRRCREGMPSVRGQVRSRALSLFSSSFLQSPVRGALQKTAGRRGLAAKDIRLAPSFVVIA